MAEMIDRDTKLFFIIYGKLIMKPQKSWWVRKLNQE